ncbi:SDR family oxidoreductase [Rhodococcus sp. BP-349]|nr:SDR family oxidoreductase [Rhodococcus sp. BP-363]MBY6544777.1 SDR family oxidoreductase [Rhodococcus sp. BP-369]MBY6564007.1 SDR family oxidoreductase [Rhodococcus sp. BP-370]MBY6579056.1 SDR family oxidoreductase [Rhodococcus sp. BP-364]MBY6588357.1 SDR family oxidoreductase [Rhodococcus sp. BP-358]MBY6592694.1 SDR family oxidoreductase [Rhodococcus sp. BP-362]MBY6596274.1 SDR family oxidoreductase [Rhodococcus sp. BP-359]MBY6600613.1 SDR family oxidoreductase [Rhodococcus sp. BP-353]M
MAPPADEVALVFGANGFVGAHLVAELSLRPGITTVYAGVRSAGDSTATERFEETVAQYSITGIDLGKIVVIEAVPTQSNFGLDEATYLQLRRTVDQVFNSASSTDYDSSYLELRQDWFVSLLRVVQFTLEDRRKHLTYMGSIGAFIYTSPEDFLRPDSWWYSGYCQMKWINGQLLGWLARDGVASVTLVESPYVLGSTTVGKDPGRVYSFWRAIELADSVGAMWDGPGMNYAPVDVLAAVLADNALGDGTLPHLVPSNPVPYSNAVLASALGLDLVPWAEFKAIVDSKIPAEKTASLLGSDVNDLIRRSNAPSLMPPSFDASTWDHDVLFALYLSVIQFRDATARRPRLVTA